MHGCYIYSSDILRTCVTYPFSPATSEDSDWSNEPSDWPSLGSDIINPGGDIIISTQDNLESVLEKLGLIKYHSLLTVRTPIYQTSVQLWSVVLVHGLCSCSLVP